MFDIRMSSWTATIIFERFALFSLRSYASKMGDAIDWLTKTHKLIHVPDVKWNLESKYIRSDAIRTVDLLIL